MIITLSQRKFTLILAFVLLVGILIFLTTLLQQTRRPQSLPGSNPVTVIVPSLIPFNPSLTTSNLFIIQADSQSVNVVVDTDSHPVTAVQFGIMYDPNVLQGLQVSAGNFFEDPIILQNQIDAKNGVILYAIAVKPGQEFPKGKGTVATISYTINPGVAGQTTLHFLPVTKITSANVNQSVLKKVTDFTMPTVQ